MQPCFWNTKDNQQHCVAIILHRIEMERMQAPFGKRGTRSGSSGKIIPGVICEVGNHIIESQDSPISRAGERHGRNSFLNCGVQLSWHGAWLKLLHSSWLVHQIAIVQSVLIQFDPS